MRSMKQLAQEAVDVQDACNLQGVVKGFDRAITDLKLLLAEANQENGTDAIRNHPISRMWASKIHDLCGMGLSDMDRYGEAYKWCLAQNEEDNKP